uniref:Zinc finger protein 606 n=1 Tax=Neovison vison TaxID=452646 RepID=A0A8C7B5I9_NEOVI
MAAINPWASWGVLTDQSWGISAVDPWASWALCPQDCHVEENAEEERRATGFPTAQIQVKWGFLFPEGLCSSLR